MGGRVARAVGAWPAVFGVAVGVSLLLPAAPAAAHNSLTGSDPRDGARVAQAPARIELRFLARPDPGTTEITVTGPDNVVALGGEPSFSGARVTVPFKPCRAGLYIVGYRVASSDGHPVSGEVRFTLTTGTPAEPASSPSGVAGSGAPSGGAGPSASAGAPARSGTSTPATVAPTSAVPAPAGTAGTVAAVPAAGEGADETGRGWLWAVGGLVLLAALGAGLLLRRRSARD